MPIIDYKYASEQSKAFLLNRKDISDTNKGYLNQFFKRYDVSPARLNLFCKHIGFLLSRVDDVKKLFKNRDLTNTLFQGLRKDLSPAYYTTVLNVSLAFVRWLNDGEKPKGFLDVKNRGNTQKRDLKPQDMITWEEGLKMIALTNSVQIKAVLMTQLDGGFRPSEFVDLNYGSIVKEGKYLIARVDGKTGKRDVILWRCIPYLQRWLSMHPTKRDNDPLWIMEDVRKSHRKIGSKNPLYIAEASKKTVYTRYDYFAIQKRIRDLIAWAKLNKPGDFYNLRHSSAVIKKIDNWPVEQAARNMGHSVEHFTETYGRLSLKDKTSMIDGVYHLSKEKEADMNNPIECKICGTVNEPGKTHCEKCNYPFTVEAALKDQQKSKKDFAMQIIELIKENPESLREALKIAEAKK